MREKKIIYIKYILVFFICIYVFYGEQFFIKIVDNVWQWIKALLGMLNFISNTFNGYGIIPTLLTGRITYLVVGGLLSLLVFPFCKFLNKKLGKHMYSNLLEHIQKILNIVNNAIFKNE